MKKIKLSNGVEMPQLGYGVYERFVPSERATSSLITIPKAVVKPTE